MSNVISDTWGHPTWPPDTNREDLWALHRSCFVYASFRVRPQIPLGIPAGSGWVCLSSSQLMKPREWFTCQPPVIYCSMSPTILWALLTIDQMTHQWLYEKLWHFRIKPKIQRSWVSRADFHHWVFWSRYFFLSGELLFQFSSIAYASITTSKLPTCQHPQCISALDLHESLLGVSQ